MVADVIIGQFELYDSDADDAVTEAEAKLILDSIIATQKAVVSELFETHVRCFTGFCVMDMLSFGMC